jgi:CheY-like chemotaxis protein
VRVDASQLQQVIMSMAANAQDAMPVGGTLVLATSNVSVSRQETSNDLRVPPGDYAVLSVSDTGVGMDEITSARVFEPFFTTKPPPAATGLGLSMAYGIVRQSSGFTTVDSQPGVGTTFRIFLPRVAATSAEVPSIHQPAAPTGRTVLVVDGDDGVRRSTCRVLEGLGYTLVSSASAEEALTMLERSEGVPDLLVTALSLPGMDGAELADRLQASIPDLRVLFLSGYALEGDDGRTDAGGKRRFLRKPFSVESLIEAVRQAG